jgi:dimethylargininase
MSANFTHAIVRRPSHSVIDGITSSPELGKPDYALAMRQHDAYIDALRQAGLEVTVLPALEDYPDSCFVEDTAVITPSGVVIDNPATASRRGEAALMLPTLQEFFTQDQFRHIKDPGTLEGGDVMMVDDHYYVGRSGRTNDEGFRQFSAAIADWGYTAEQVPVTQILHLKTGGTYLEDNILLVSGEFKKCEHYEKFKRIMVPDEEAYAADCIRINDKVLVASGYPQVLSAIKAFGYETIVLDMSEFRKIDGSLTCLSLRF